MHAVRQLRSYRAASQASASARNPSTGIVSARACGSSPATSTKASPPINVRLDRSILRRCPNAAAVIYCKASRRAGEGRVAKGSRRTTADSTLGGGLNARAGTSMTRRALQVACTITAKRP